MNTNLDQLLNQMLELAENGENIDINAKVHLKLLRQDILVTNYKEECHYIFLGLEKFQKNKNNEIILTNWNVLSMLHHNMQDYLATNDSKMKENYWP